MKHCPQRVLVVDDDPVIRQYLREVIERLGYEVSTASDGETFQRSYQASEPDVILLDLIMPGTDGADLLKFLAASRCEIPIVLMSGLDDRALRAANRLGKTHGLRMFSGLEKPFDRARLEEVLTRTGLERCRLAEQNLMEAIDRGELRLYYQPQVNAADGRLLGAEALLRWQHPEYGVLLPGYFLQLAKDPEVIRSMTRWVCSTALAQLGQWRKDNVRLTMSINLTAADVLDESFSTWLLELVADNGLETSQVVLEVTEQMATADNEEVAEALTRLRLKGFQLSIDDFGTGYSSMARLQRIPFGELKIDKCFIMEALEDPDAKTIVEVLVNLGRTLGMRVVAEGVEDEPTLNVMRELGLSVIQGYFTGRPVPAEVFMRGFHGSSWSRQIA